MDFHGSQRQRADVGLCSGCKGGSHIITSSIEHDAALKPVRFLRSLGARVTILPVDRQGIVDPDAVREAICPETVLVSVMMANNEIGTLQLIKKIAAITRQRRILFHTEAAQAVGKVGVGVRNLDVDMLSLSGHKFGAPNGIGGLPA